MKYTLKSFTLPASAGTKAECERVGHAWPDQRGRCIRCGAELTDKPQHDLDEREHLGRS